MERAAEIYAAVWFLIIGASHLGQPLAWVEFFTHLRGAGRTGAFVEGFLLLVLGAPIVALHPVWTGLATVVTVVGWLLLLKATVRFVSPDLVLRVYGRVSPERSWEFRVAGVVSLLLGGLFAWVAWQR